MAEHKVYSFFKNSTTEPNLLVHNVGRVDLTATFAHIELNYGSNTVCDEVVALKRRAAKERLKLICVQYAYMGPDENDDDFNSTAERWLLPERRTGTERFYTVFTPKEG